jgi:hypothetical protein
MVGTASRADLENALTLIAPQERQTAARAFVEALAVDELRFLAEFLGGYILATSSTGMNPRDVMYRRAQEYRRSPGNEDMNHKLLVLTEFAERCRLAIRLA